MKLNAQLRDKLAAEYVLGTLHGGARRRFEQILRGDTQLQDAVAQWARHLNPLGAVAPAIAPPPRVWQGIAAKLAGDTAAAAKKPRWWQALSLWRGLTLAASLATVVLSVYLWRQPPPEPVIVTVQVPVVVPVYVSVLQDQKAQSAWLVSAEPEKSQLRVKALQTQALADDKDFELWLLPGAQQAPVSMGLIPQQGEKALTVSKALLANVGSAQAFAVSLEPKGGSTTGAPTGPVLYQGQVHQL